MHRIAQLQPFKLEKYLEQYEFSVPYLLCCSDAQSFLIKEILQLASQEQIQAWDNLTTGYTEIPGAEVLRDQIVTSCNYQLTKDNILCFAGAEEAIFCGLTAICQPGDHAIIITPCYQGLLEVPRINGVAITTVELALANNWELDLNKITHAIQSNTKVLVMNFPHNPTGQIITEEQLKELVSVLDKKGIYLFADEVYRLLGPAGTNWSSPAVNKYYRAISVGVMSKAYGLPGVRIGWIAAHDPALLNAVKKIKHYTSICNSGPSEILAWITLSQSDKILQRNNSIVQNNIRLLDEFFVQHADKFSWVRPKGGCIGFVKLHLPKSVIDFCDDVIKNAGVLLLPDWVYDLDINHFRIGFGRSNMSAALEKFDCYLRQ